MGRKPERVGRYTEADPLLGKTRTRMMLTAMRRNQLSFTDPTGMLAEANGRSASVVAHRHRTAGRIELTRPDSGGVASTGTRHYSRHVRSGSFAASAGAGEWVGVRGAGAPPGAAQTRVGCGVRLSGSHGARSMRTQSIVSRSLCYVSG